MRCFTDEDRRHAVELMLQHVDPADRHLRGAMSGLKQRARTRAVIAFGQRLTPLPPDQSITTMRTILREIFGGRGISNNELHRYFSTPGRKADDKVDLAVLRGWYDEHHARFKSDAESLMRDLDGAWKRFTADAAREAGRRRHAET